MKIAILTSNTGVEKVELDSPIEAARQHGWTVEHLAPKAGDVQTMNQDINKDAVVQADTAVADAKPDDYDGLIIPGGTVNADTLRLNNDAVNFIRAYSRLQRPIAAICHGPWALVEAGLVRDKNLTSYASLRTDIENAGGHWRDEEVVHCRTDDWDLVTSRGPDDLPAFNQKTAEVFGGQGGGEPHR